MNQMSPTKKATITAICIALCGIAQALVIPLLGTGEAFGVTIWATTSLIAAIPGIISHLILVPLLYLTLERARVIPRRYSKEK